MGCGAVPASPCQQTQTVLTLQHPARVPGEETRQRVCLRPSRHLPDPHHHKGCTARMPQGPTHPRGAGDTAAGLPPLCHVPPMHWTPQSRSPCWDLVPAAVPGDTGPAAGTGCEAVARGERQVNLPLELPSANNKTMPGRGRLRNQRRGGEVVIFGFSTQ